MRFAHRRPLDCFCGRATRRAGRTDPPRGRRCVVPLDYPVRWFQKRWMRL